MPELPEVETVRRRLADRVESRRIDAVAVHDSRWCAPASTASIERAVAGRLVESTSRRGKYLIWNLDGGIHLVMHLRMTGTLLYDPEPAPIHGRVEFCLSDGHVLWFSDPRRFGTGAVIESSRLDAYFAERLGLEPFDPAFDQEHLFQLTRRRNAPLKSFLLDQRRIAGIGNIYADEAMFRAGVHPLKRPSTLTRAQAGLLRDGIVAALAAGIDAGGATIDDFRDPDGAWGAYQSEFLVHRREGLPCPDCGTAIKREVVGGRSTYHCPQCQPRPRVRRS